MSLYERHIFKRISLSFLFVLGSLTGVVWVTQALRRLDLVTVKGQTVWLFVEMTVMALPSLIIVITPFAILFSLVSTLSVLHGDSELVVINSTGGSRMVVLRPILIFVVLSSLLMALMTVYLAPLAKRHLRDLITEVRADFIASVVVPGRFSSVEKGLTVHIRDRSSDGALLGLLLHDEREPDNPTTILSKKGVVTEKAGLTLLFLTSGSIHRQSAGSETAGNRSDDPSSAKQRDKKSGQETKIIDFDQYAFDLSSLTNTADADSAMKPSERTTAELLNLDRSEWYVQARYGRFIAELHERFAQPLYPVVFGLIVILFLGDPRTNRQGRNMAVAGAIVGCVVARTGGFILNSVVLTVPSTAFIALLYVFPAVIIAISLGVILTGRALSAPGFVFDYLERALQAAQSAAAFLSRKRVGNVQTT